MHVKSRQALSAIAAYAAAGVAALTVLSAAAHAAQTVVVPASRDNTLIEDASGRRANGTGPNVFAGRVGAPRDARRRAVLAFDLGELIPPGSRVFGAALLLHLDRAGGSDANVVTVHRLLAPWGEGDSFGRGGGGAPAAPGDATWLHTFFDAEFWGAPGGDFAPLASGSTLIDEPGWYAWGPGEALAADVQGWVDDPASNHGWVLIGDESAPSTVKAFDSRESEESALRPVLVVHFSLPAGRRDRGRQAGLGLDYSATGEAGGQLLDATGAARAPGEESRLASPMSDTDVPPSSRLEQAIDRVTGTSGALRSVPAARRGVRAVLDHGRSEEATARRERRAVVY